MNWDGGIASGRKIELLCGPKKDEPPLERFRLSTQLDAPHPANALPDSSALEHPQ